MNSEEIQLFLPQSFKERLVGYEWQEILIGCSESKVFRLTHQFRETLYLKVAADDSFPSLRQENARLDWLQGKLPVPQLLIFSASNGLNYLLMTEISGVNSEEVNFRGTEREFIQQLIAGINQIHAVPIEDCPFDMRLDEKIKLAEERMRNGLVDESDFDEERIGRTAESLFSELIEIKPTAEDLVFTHGDFCLPNIIFNENKLSGFIDMANCGIADRYQDLALLARSLKDNLGGERENILFEEMNIKPDAEKIRFYTLLDEFF